MATNQERAFKGALYGTLATMGIGIVASLVVDPLAGMRIGNLAVAVAALGLGYYKADESPEFGAAMMTVGVGSLMVAGLTAAAGSTALTASHATTGTAPVPGAPPPAPGATVATAGRLAPAGLITQGGVIVSQASVPVSAVTPAASLGGSSGCLASRAPAGRPAGRIRQQVTF